MNLNEGKVIGRTDKEIYNKQIAKLYAKIKYYQYVFDNFSDAVLIFCNSPKDIIVNLKFLQLFKIKSVAELNKYLVTGYEIADKRELGLKTEDIKKILREEHSIVKECHCEDKNTEKFSGEIYLRSLIDPDEKTPVGYSLVIKDITEKKTALHTEKEHNKFLESLIDTVPLPLFYKNRKGIHLLVNKAYEAYACRDKEDIIGKKASEIYSEKLALKCEAEEKVMYEKKGDHRFEELFPHIDGTLHNVLVRETPYIDFDKNLQGTIGTFFDITDLRSIRSSLSFRRNFEKILLEISSTFINIAPADVDEMIEKSLQKIVTFVGVNEGFMLELSKTGLHFSMTHLYSRFTSSEIKNNFKNVRFKSLPYFKKILDDSDLLNVNNIDELPEYAYNEKRIFKDSGIKSIIAVPVWFQKKIHGYLGFSSSGRLHEWTKDEVRLLRFAGEVFISALERKKSNNAILYHEKILQTFTLNLEKFFVNNDWGLHITDLLASLGKCLSVGRMFLCETYYHEGIPSIDYKYEWCNENIEPLVDNEQLENLNPFQNIISLIYEELYKGEIFKSSTETMNNLLNPLLSKFNIKSLLLIPVHVKNKNWGVLGLTEDVDAERTWTDTEIDPLKIVAHFMGLSIERSMAIKAVSEEEQKFRNIFDQSNDSIIIMDFTGKILVANKKFRNEDYIKSGYHQKQYFQQFLTKEFKDKFKNRIKKLERDEKLSITEYEMRNLVGEKRIVELNSATIDYRNQKAILTIIRDITERKELEKKLMETIIQTEEKERQRFAVDLHDELGPLLSGIKLYISELASETNTVQQRKEMGFYLEEMVDEAVNKIRAISNNLMPNVLLDYGLEKGLKEFINKLNLVYSSTIELNFRGNSKSIESTLEIVIYRIVIELINNSIKHGNADLISVEVKFYLKRIEIIYKDDGIGFNLKKELKYSGGIGLLSMLNRLATVHGTYKFESKKNEGIMFKFLIPRE